MKKEKKKGILVNKFINMRFRYKIITLPVFAIIALFVILFVSWFLGIKNKSLVSNIEGIYYPSLETNWDLKEILTNVQSGFQNAVQSEDLDKLTENDSFRDSFLATTNASKQKIPSATADLDELENIFFAYYPLARQVSQQMIEGTFTDDLTAKIESMSSQYNSLINRLESSIAQRKKNILEAFSTTERNQNISNLVNIGIALICISLLGWASFLLIQSTTKPLNELVELARELAKGNSDLKINIQSEDEIGELADVFETLIESNKELAHAASTIGNGDYSVPITIRSKEDTLGNALSIMKSNLSSTSKEIQENNWSKTGQTELNNKMRGIQDPLQLAQNIISYLAKYLNAQIGAVYLSNGNKNELVFSQVGSFAFTTRKNISNHFKLGEGIVGQAALEKQPILLTDVPDDYVHINSALGNTPPKNILVYPFLYEGQVKGIIELGSLDKFSDRHMTFLNEVAENVAIGFASAQSRVQMKELLDKTQQQAEELQSQQEELRQINEELEEQAKILKESEAKLQIQQEELQQTNEELEEKTQTLEKQKEEIRLKNTDLENTKIKLEEKAMDLELTSKYKSEFLSNMSHELRTPLNSLLILSKLLGENKDKNLTEKQKEYVQTIYSAGTDLLELINEILDLSKVESGKIELNIENINLKSLSKNIKRNFEHLTQDKGLSFGVKTEDNLCETISSDPQRLDQIIKNFISNAVKFTEKGGITISIHRPRKDIDLAKSNLDPDKTIAISVADTGKGIAKDKQKIIFEAFQQEDGSTSRKYGGTGLGLSISRELARLLGGEIQLESEVGIGSTFTLYLPEEHSPIKKSQSQIFSPTSSGLKSSEEISSGYQSPKPESELKQEPPASGTYLIDDRKNISSRDKSILIIEDDMKFAKILYDLAHEHEFKCLIAEDGEQGLVLANQFKPSAIILDITLPGIDGWTVMEKLKDNPETWHIPVHFISASEKTIDAMKMGAIGFLTKPVNPKKLNLAFKKIEDTIAKTIKKLLVVEDDEIQRKSIIELIGNGDVKTLSVATGQEALQLLRSDHFDCMILDLGLGDISGFELVEKMKNDPEIPDVPIIIYTGKELTKKEQNQLQKHAESIIIKGVKSPERLLDETTLFLHRVEKNLPEDKQKILRLLHDKEKIFQDKKILVVDDDMRNVFALASILEEKKMKTLIAQNGRESLEILEKNPDIDLVLMDIMMPEMDGYEAIREIRKQKKFQNLPVIAVTAKAMRGDRNKCIEAGANDYLAKPVNTEKLFSLLRVWLYQ
ncbi:MAG: response regulator [Candidatus Aminicenantes bacterium]|nr:response regulator [Candidatus Aminicenantes bacterium]